MYKWISTLALLLATATAQGGYEKALDIDQDFVPIALTRSGGQTLLSTQGNYCFWGGTPAKIYSVDAMGNLTTLFRSTNPINLQWCHSGPYIWVAGQYQYGDVITDDFIVYRFTPEWQPVDTLAFQLPEHAFFLGMGKAEDGGVHLLFSNFVLKMRADGQGIARKTNYPSFSANTFTYLGGRFWCKEPGSGLCSIDTNGTIARTRLHKHLQYVKADTTHHTLVVATPDSLCWYDGQLNLLAAYRLPVGTDSLLSINAQGDTVVLGARLFGAQHLLSYARSQGVLHAPVFTMGLLPGLALLEPNGDLLLAANTQPVVLRTYRQGQWFTTGYAVRVEKAEVDRVDFRFVEYIPLANFSRYDILIHSRLTIRNTGIVPIDSIYLRQEEYPGENYMGNCGGPYLTGPHRLSPPLQPGQTTQLVGRRLWYHNSPDMQPGEEMTGYYSAIVPNQHWNNDTAEPAELVYTYTSRSGALPTLPLQAYPNPATTYLTIAGDAHGATLRLHSIDGRLLHSQPYSPGLRLDLSPYAAGLYLLEVVSAQGVYRERIVKSE